MDGNYEAQKHFTSQRLAARRDQAQAERLLRRGRPARMSGLRQFLGRLLRPAGRQEAKKGEPESAKARLALTGKGK